MKLNFLLELSILFFINLLQKIFPYFVFSKNIH